MGESDQNHTAKISWNPHDIQLQESYPLHDQPLMQRKRCNTRYCTQLGPHSKIWPKRISVHYIFNDLQNMHSTSLRISPRKSKLSC